jgi:hypothetical protein
VREKKKRFESKRMKEASSSKVLKAVLSTSYYVLSLRIRIRIRLASLYLLCSLVRSSSMPAV